MLKISIGAAIAVAGVFVTMLTAGVLTSSQVPLSSSITSDVNVGVYTDSACTNNCTSIYWGNIAPTYSTNRTVYVKNAGTVPITLSMTTTSWAPSNAVSYLTATWNKEGYVLAAGNSTSATLTLIASASAGNITNFNFNIVITGTQ